jgi:hypothetical protein
MTVSEAETQLSMLVRPRKSWHELKSPTGWNSESDPPFIGWVDEHRFKFRRDVRGKNSFLPIITGSITRDDAGAALDMTMRAAVPVIVVMAAWMAATTYRAVQLLGHARSTSTTELLVGLTLPLFGIILTASGFIPEVRRAARILRSAYVVRDV